jgi:periplasmic protein TonB
VFDEVMKREGGKRVATRSAWLAGSTAVQTALVVAVIAVSTAVAKQVTDTPVVDVKFVKPPAPPKPPAAPPAPPRKTPPKPKTVEAPKRPPPMAMVQPKEMPQELKPPDPNEPPEPEYESGEGEEGGVVGGVVGGLTGGEPAPAAPEPPKAAPPVAFDSSMNAPNRLQGPPLEYTQKALEHEVEGTMLVRCIVDIDGSVRDCRVMKSVPFMDRAVIEVLERSKYQPATRRGDGKSVAVDYVFTIQLRLPR